MSEGTFHNFRRSLLASGKVTQKDKLYSLVQE